MSTSSHEYLTVAEAAELLRVSVSTIRRWIREGTMSAHRVGSRRLLLKRGDLLDSIHAVRQESQSIDPPGFQHSSPQPAMPGPAGDEPDEKHIRQLRTQLGLPPEGETLDLGPIAGRIVYSPDRPIDRRLTSEEQARAFAAIERDEAFSDKLLALNGGKLFSSSTELIHEMRNERTRQLLGEEHTDPESTA
jgi:excisionase family DNA binding protein